MDIFEQYFYDLNQFLSMLGNDTLYADMVDILEEKIEVFHTLDTISGSNNEFDLPNDYYRLAQIRSNGVEVEKLTHKKLLNAINSPLTTPTLSRPAYYVKDTRIIAFPDTINSIDVNYIRKPIKVNWTYVVLNKKALYNSSALDLQDFELHVSEEVDLVLKILTLAGISTGTELYTTASTEDKKNVQQEKLK